MTSDVIDGRLSPINLWSPPSPPSTERHADHRHHRRTESGGYQHPMSSVDDDRDSGIGKYESR